MYKLAIWILAITLIGGLWLALRRPSPAQAVGHARRRTGDTLADWPPEPTRVLSLPERHAYALLREVCPPDYMIFAHVPVSRFVRVAMHNAYAEWMRRVGNSCVDLLVCDAAARVVAAIEVRRPDKAAAPATRPPPARTASPGLPPPPVDDRIQRRRERVARVLNAAGIPVHVWHEGHFPDAESVRQSLVEEDDPGTETQPAALFALAPNGPHHPTGSLDPAHHNGSHSLPSRRPVPSTTGPVRAVPPVTPHGQEPNDPLPSTWFDAISTDLPADTAALTAPQASKPPEELRSTKPGRTPSP